MGNHAIDGRGSIVNGLRNRNFTPYWVATLFYFAGMHMETTAYSLLIYTLTKSAFLLGLATAISALPDLVSILGGFMADLLKKKKILHIAQTILGINALFMAFLLSIGVVEYSYIVMLSFIHTTALQFVTPARLAYIPELVKKEDFMNAYSLFYIAMNIMRISGPLIAGVLASTVGIAGVYFAVGICHLAFNIPLRATQPLEVNTERSTFSMMEDMKKLLSFARHNTTILTLIGLGIGLTILSQSANILNPIFAEELGVGAIGLGLINSAAGVGALIGSILSAFISHSKRKPMLLLGSGIFKGAVLVLFASSKIFYLSLFFMALGGIAEGIHTTSRSALFQLCATNEMRGRIMSLYFMTSEFRPLGTIIIGSLAQNYGASLAVGVFGLLWTAVCAAVSLVRPKFRSLEI